MNRRTFLGISASCLTALTHLPVAAIDVRRIESPLMQLLDQIPDRAGANEISFPPTACINNLIRETVPGEVRDMYWDPYGEDLNTLFGISSAAVSLTSIQNDPDVFEMWKLDPKLRAAKDVEATLMANGWTLADSDLRYLRFEGSDEARKTLANSLNLVGATIAEGRWDHIALPDDVTMVLGADAELHRTAADRVKHYTSLTPIHENFHAMGTLLPVRTYAMNLLPPEILPIPGVTAACVSKSYYEDGPIVHSVGVRTENNDQTASLVDELPQRMSEVVSPTRNLHYGDFLDLTNVNVERSSARFDFVVTDGEWDVLHAAISDDLCLFTTLE